MSAPHASETPPALAVDSSALVGIDVQLPDIHFAFRSPVAPNAFWNGNSTAALQSGISLLDNQPIIITKALEAEGFKDLSTLNRSGKWGFLVTGTKPATSRKLPGSQSDSASKDSGHPISISSAQGSYVDSGLDLTTSFFTKDSEEYHNMCVSAIAAFRMALRHFYSPSVPTPALAHLRGVGESVSPRAIHHSGMVWYPIAELLEIYNKYLDLADDAWELVLGPKMSELANGQLDAERWEAYFAVDTLPIEATQTVITPKNLSVRAKGEATMPAASSVSTKSVTRSVTDSSPWSDHFYPFGDSYAAFGTPSTAVHKGLLYVMWALEDRSNQMFGTFDGDSWSTPVPFQDADTGGVVACIAPPVLVDLNDTLHVLIPGADAADHTLMHYIFNDDPSKPAWKRQSWSAAGKTTIPVAVRAFSGVLFCVWLQDGTTKVNWAVFAPYFIDASPTDGVWTPGSSLTISGATSANVPALLVLEGKLCMMWAAQQNQKIAMMTYTPGSTLLNGSWASAKSPLSEYSDKGVACACSLEGDQGLVVFMEHYEQAILCCIYVNGSWDAHEPTGQATNDDASVAWYNGAYYMLYQQSYGHPINQFYCVTRSTGAPIHTGSWMKNFVNPNRWLNTIIIPGTHDSATYNPIAITKVGAIQTQTLSFPGQLFEGVRFFDFRLGFDLLTGKIIIFKHGGVPVGVTLFEALEAMYVFLTHQPGEVLIVCATNEGSNDTEAQLWAAFDAFIKDPSDPSKLAYLPQWYVGGEDFPTLGEARGQIVLLRRFKPQYPPTFGVDLSRYAANAVTQWGIPDDDDPGLWIDEQDCYDVSSNDEKWSYVRGSLERSVVDYGTHGTDSITLFLNYSSASNYPLFFPQYFAMGTIISTGQNDRLLSYFALPTTAYGVIAMDFPEEPDGELLPALILSNNFNLPASGDGGQRRRRARKAAVPSRT